MSSLPSLQDISADVENVCHKVIETLEKEEVNQNQSKEVNQAFQEKTLK